MECKKVILDDVAEVKSGKRLPKGRELQSESNSHPYIRIRDMYKNKYLNIDSEIMYVPDDIYPSISKYIVNTDDVILANVGNTIGLVSKIGTTLNNANLTENCVKFVNLNGITSDYLYYYLISDVGQKEIEKGIVGSSQPKLPLYNIKKFSIELPTIGNQLKICKILSNIDNKIEINNKINNNLYEFSNSIFKKWFIQFEYPDFNGNLKESELGKIPEDWEIGYFDDSKLTSIIKSGVDKFEGTKKYVATADVTEKKITNYEEVSYNEKPSRANMTPRISSVWFAKMENSVKNILVDSYMKDILNNYIFSTGFMGVECINNSLYYIWNIINDDKFLQEKNSLSTGTLMAGISNSTIKNYKYLIPDQNTLHKFNEIQLNINKKIYNNSIQNEKLSQLRDTLLPKLMNGEIDLDNIEI